MYEILVVDDETVASKYLKKILVAKGHSVSVSSNAEGALAKMRSNPFDIILLDIRMPGIDGIEILRQIRKCNNHVAIIMLSALSDESVVDKSLAEGADYFMVKPADIRELIDDAIPYSILKRSSVDSSIQSD
jgi:DNA-binding response OmpR family regulator